MTKKDSSGLRNPFPHRVRLLYLYVYACFNCARSDRGIELHHIFGRESPAAFNACPLCRFCHSQVTNTQTECSRFFYKNQEFLLANQYKPLEEDFALVEKHYFLTKTEDFYRVFGKAR